MAAAVLGWLVGVAITGSVGGADQPLLLSSALSSAYLSSRLVTQLTQPRDNIQHLKAQNFNQIKISITPLVPRRCSRPRWPGRPPTT